MGRLDPSAITAMMGSDSLSEWEVSNPFGKDLPDY